MNAEQEKNLLYIKQHFELNADLKYRKGDMDHGGNLIDMSPRLLLENAIFEAIDQVVYLVTLKRKLDIEMEKDGQQKTKGLRKSARKNSKTPKRV